MKALTPEVNVDSALAYFGAASWISQPYGKFLIEADSARDFASMRADQLSSLLLLIRLDGARAFRDISDDHQLNILWLASQLADDLQRVLPMAMSEAQGAKA